MLCVSGADLALYCANNFRTVLVNDADYKDNLDEALKRAFTRLCNNHVVNIQAA